MPRKLITLALAGTTFVVLGGCSGATDVSRQPSGNEIQQAIDRRIAEVDKTPGLTPEQKDRMKAQIRGTNQAQSSRPTGR